MSGGVFLNSLQLDIATYGAKVNHAVDPAMVSLVASKMKEHACVFLWFPKLATAWSQCRWGQDDGGVNAVGLIGRLGESRLSSQPSWRRPPGIPRTLGAEKT